MRILRSCYLLPCAVLLLCGFSWGMFGDPCKEALTLADSLDTLHDETLSRQTEAKILAMCPDGAGAHYVNALVLERVGNVDGAINEYRQALRQDGTFAKASGNLGFALCSEGAQQRGFGGVVPRAGRNAQYKIS